MQEYMGYPMKRASDVASRWEPPRNFKNARPPNSINWSRTNDNG